MRKGRFTEEQIIKVLKEPAAEMSENDLCRKHGIGDATLYKWRSRDGGVEISDARKLKGLEEENRKLKKLLAESMLAYRRRRRCSEETSDARLAVSRLTPARLETDHKVKEALSTGGHKNGLQGVTTPQVRSYGLKSL